MSTASPVSSAEVPNPKRSLGRSYDMQFHGTAEFRGGNCPTSVYYNRGRFGRLFPALPPLRTEPHLLMHLGKKGGLMDGSTPENNPDHPGLPAGFTFLGQFIDHDITFDPTSSLERQVDPEAVENFRTPTLELDNLYGSGPGAHPHLYRRHDRALLLTAAVPDSSGFDLPRNPEGTALIGDPRNDENLIVSQLHLAMLRFHNAIVEEIRPNLSARETLFEAAQRIVRWHYQWIVLNEYLPNIVGRPMVEAALASRRFFNWQNEPFIPVEFAVAAFRFGHTQVRPGYTISESFSRPIFSPATSGDELPSDLSGGRPMRKEQLVQWARFFNARSEGPQLSKRFDTRISTPLLDLPFAAGSPADPRSLAQRNLMRGLTFGLPSGQAVARAMAAEHQKDVGPFGVTPVTILGEAELPELKELDLQTRTPLWYYILREAELLGGGSVLGPVGGRIVAEVFVGLLQGDRLSYLRADPEWEPLFGIKEQGIAGLLKKAGVLNESSPSDVPSNMVWTPA